MKNLGFGMMRLPVINGEPTNFDYEQLNKMVDAFLEAGYNYFDTSFVYAATCCTSNKMPWSHGYLDSLIFVNATSYNINSCIRIEPKGISVYIRSNSSYSAVC